MAAELRPGDRFSGCEIIALCGRGTFGVTWLAADPLGRVLRRGEGTGGKKKPQGFVVGSCGHGRGRTGEIPKKNLRKYGENQ